MGKKKSKKKKVFNKSQFKPVVESEEVVVETEDEIVINSENSPKTEMISSKEEKVSNTKKTKSSKDFKSKKKENPNTIGKKIKGIISELKKVTWPTFGELCKQTSIVLAFCLVFVLILLGLNTLFGWLFDLITDII